MSRCYIAVKVSSQQKNVNPDFTVSSVALYGITETTEIVYLEFFELFK